MEPKSRKSLQRLLMQESPNFPTVGNPVNTLEVTRYMETLKKANIPDLYFWVFDLRDASFPHYHGVKRCLGYSQPFDLVDTVSFIHPKQVERFVEYRKKLYEIVTSPRQVLKPLLNLVRFWLGVRHADGHYLYVKQLITPFEVDRENRLVSHLSYFIVVREFRNEELRIELDETITDRELIKGVLDIKKETLHPFSKREFELLKKMKEDPELNSLGLSRHFSISKYTIDNHKKSIKRKANEFYPGSFNNARDVVSQLIRVGLI